MAENQDPEDLTSQNQDEGAEDDIAEDEGAEDIDALGAEDTEDVEKLKENNRKLFERAKKAEGFVKDKEGKWVKKAPKAPVTEKKPNEQQNQPPKDADPYEKDELRLIARGLSDAEIQKARVIAKGAGISLLKATEDDLFLTFQADLKEKEKKEKAKLGASRGSGQGETKPKFKPGMTRDEHKAAWAGEEGK